MLQRIGDMAEERFLTAANIKTLLTPEWFIKVEAGGVAWDVRGIDAFAYIEPIDGSKRMIVPIQVKSSTLAKERYIRKYPQHVTAGVVIMVVQPYRTDDEIRHQLYSFLGQVRNKNERYDEFLRRTMSQRLSYRGRQIRRMLIRRKAETSPPQS
jgi:hypothetical protein